MQRCSTGVLRHAVSETAQLRDQRTPKDRSLHLSLHLCDQLRRSCARPTHAPEDGNIHPQQCRFVAANCSSQAPWRAQKLAPEPAHCASAIVGLCTFEKAGHKSQMVPSLQAFRAPAETVEGVQAPYDVRSANSACVSLRLSSERQHSDRLRLASLMRYRLALGQLDSSWHFLSCRLALGLLLTVGTTLAAPPAKAELGEQVFNQNCGLCAQCVRVLGPACINLLSAFLRSCVPHGWQELCDP